MSPEEKEALSKLYPNYYKQCDFAANKVIYDRLWQDAVFVPDTNVMLDLYRLHSDSSRDFIEKFTQLASQNRFFIPHRVGHEFLKNRRDVIEKKSASMETQLSKFTLPAKSIGKGDVSERHFSFTYNKLLAVLESEKKSNEAFKQYIEQPDTDHVMNFLGSMSAAQHIGNQISPDSMRDIMGSIWSRRINELPPGYLDGDSIYGDCIIWYQMIAYGKAIMRNILFITRDEKADWWCDPYKLTHCRHELMDEYRAKTNFLFNTITVNEFGARQNFSDETQQDVESNALLSQDSITPDIFSLIEQLRDDCFEGIRRAELIEQTYSITDQQTLRDMMITANTFYHTVQDHLYHIRQKKMIEFMESRHAITYAFDSSRLFEQTFMNMPFDYGLREEHVRRIIELGFKLIEVIRKYKPKYGDYIFRYYSETVAATLSTVLHRPLNPQQQPKTTP